MDDLPDFGAHMRCRFYPCRGCPDVSALLGRNEDLARRVTELESELEVAREHIARFEKLRR